MHKLRTGLIIDRVQKIKTEDSKDFFFGNVLLIKMKFFSKDLTPFHLDSGKRITEMKLFNESDREYHTININTIKKAKYGFTVEFLD